MIQIGLIFLVVYSMHLLLKEVVNFKKGKPINYLVLVMSLTSFLAAIIVVILMIMGFDA